MHTEICPQCGATFDSREAFAAHYAAEHPERPFINAGDTPVTDEGGRSWGGTESTDADRPLNVIEETMEESPEDTAEAVAEAEERRGAA